MGGRPKAGPPLGGRPKAAPPSPQVRGVWGAGAPQEGQFPKVCYAPLWWSFWKGLFVRVLSAPAQMPKSLKQENVVFLRGDPRCTRQKSKGLSRRPIASAGPQGRRRIAKTVHVGTNCLRRKDSRQAGQVTGKKHMKRYEKPTLLQPPTHPPPPPPPYTTKLVYPLYRTYTYRYVQIHTCTYIHICTYIPGVGSWTGGGREWHLEFYAMRRSTNNPATDSSP